MPSINPFKNEILIHDFFPARTAVPFGDYLTKLFFDPRGDNNDFPIHGPNVVRLAQALFDDNLAEPGLLAEAKDATDETRRMILDSHSKISEALGLKKAGEAAFTRMAVFLSIAALYHDIGKTIRRANHPQIGANILRNFNQHESGLLVNSLEGVADTDMQNKHSRFSLICSITQHHDKFGVVSTGEGGLPIFSDILYFTSDERELEGILKNVTSVMVLNLADIAAVVPGTTPKDDKVEALRLAKEVGRCREAGGSVHEEKGLIDSWVSIIKKPTSCLGLKHRKVLEILQDWNILTAAIEDKEVRGNRTRLKRRLLQHEQNPARTIHRVLRLLSEAIETSNATPLMAVMSPTPVESVLVGALGSHQFQSFCQRFANIVKLDYGLVFFKGIVCACTRTRLNQLGVAPAEHGDFASLSLAEVESLRNLPINELQSIGSHITALFVKVLDGLVDRYASVLESVSSDARRFGFQMRDLTTDPNIRDTILGLLCTEQNKDHIALTWITDEVSVWSMD